MDELYWIDPMFSVYYEPGVGYYWVNNEGQVGVNRFNMVSTTVEEGRRING